MHQCALATRGLNGIKRRSLGRDPLLARRDVESKVVSERARETEADIMLAEFDHRQTEDFYDEYYARQVGDGLSVYAGKTVMDGDGLGSFLGGVLSKMAPVLKTVAKSAAQSVGKNALSVMQDVAGGASFKDAALGGLKRAGGDVLGDVFEAVGSQRRSGRKRAAKPRGGKRSKRKRTVLN